MIARVTIEEGEQFAAGSGVYNLKAYIDDVVIKSKIADNLIADLEETFANLKRYR